jgi:hypothetical protein
MKFSDLIETTAGGTGQGVRWIGRAGAIDNLKSFLIHHPLAFPVSQSF